MPLPSTPYPCLCFCFLLSHSKLHFSDIGRPLSLSFPLRNVLGPDIVHGLERCEWPPSVHCRLRTPGVPRPLLRAAECCGRGWAEGHRQCSAGMRWKGGGYPLCDIPSGCKGTPPPPSRVPSLCPATAPLTPGAGTIMASMAFVTDRNRHQPLWQHPPTACLPTSGAPSEVPSLLMHPRCRRVALQLCRPWLTCRLDTPPRVQDSLDVAWVDSGCDIRFCYTLLNTSKRTSTEIVEESPAVAPEVGQSILQRYTELLPAVQAVVISGSKAKGFAADLYPTMVQLAKAQGTPLPW